MSVLSELRRRNVFKVCATYAVIAWLLVQIVVSIEAPLSLPDWFDTAVIVLLIAAFPIVAFLTWVYEVTPEGLKRTADVDPAVSATQATGRRLNGLLVGLLIAALAFVVVDAYVLDDDEAGSLPGALEGPIPENSIVVLPFADVSPGRDQSYFSDGLSDELINYLTRLGGLDVTARTSAFFFRDRDVDVPTIAQTLGVNYVLDGSVRKDGDEIRITVQLIDARTNFQVWSQTYDRMLDDIFEIQDDIANSIAQTIGVSLGVGEVGRFPGMTRNIAAYEEMLRATSGLAYDATVDEIIGHLEKAVDLDPESSVLWGLLAAVAWRAAPFTPDVDELRTFSAGALERARALTPDSPLVLSISGQQLAANGRWFQAGAAFERLLAVAPEHTFEHRVLEPFATFLHYTGHTSEAVSYFERIRRADPLNFGISRQLIEAYASVGDFDAAFAEVERSRERSAVAVASGFIAALGSGDRERIDGFLPLMSAAGIPPRPSTAVLLEHTDDPEMAVAELRRLANDSDGWDAFEPYLIATYAAYLGDTELALDMLRRLAAGNGSGPLAELIWRPVMADVRRQPAFKDIVRDIGLVEYWREYGWGENCTPAGDDDFECR